MELDCFAHVLLRFLGCCTCGDTAWQIQSIGRISRGGFSTTIRYFIFQFCLFEYAIQRAMRKLHRLVFPEPQLNLFEWVFILPVTAFCPCDVPAIPLKQLYHLFDFHNASVVRTRPCVNSVPTFAAAAPRTKSRCLRLLHSTIPPAQSLGC